MLNNIHFWDVTLISHTHLMFRRESLMSVCVWANNRQRK